MAAAYDYWLLDLDGTLVDTAFEYKRRVFDVVEHELGHTFDDRGVERLWYGLGGDRDRQLRERSLDPEAFWSVFDAVDDPVERAAATHLYDDADVVADLDGPVGVVTHCPEPTVEHVLDRLEIRDWFDATVACSSDLGWKPAPEPLHAAVERLPVDPASHRGVYVGDGETDVAAAWNAGIDGVHVERHGHEARGACVLGDHRVGSLASLPSVAGDRPGRGSAPTGTPTD